MHYVVTLSSLACWAHGSTSLGHKIQTDFLSENSGLQNQLQSFKKEKKTFDLEAIVTAHIVFQLTIDREFRKHRDQVAYLSLYYS